MTQHPTTSGARSVQRTDATDATPDGGGGGQSALARAVQDVTTHAQALVREEVELAKAEVTLKAKSLGKGAAIGAAAGVFALGALLLILHGLAWLVWYLFFRGGDAFFLGFFIVAVVLLIVAAVAGFVASRMFKKGTPPTPQMAID